MKYLLCAYLLNLYSKVFFKSRKFCNNSYSSNSVMINIHNSWSKKDISAYNEISCFNLFMLTQYSSKCPKENTELKEKARHLIRFNLWWSFSKWLRIRDVKYLKFSLSLIGFFSYVRVTNICIWIGRFKVDGFIQVFKCYRAQSQHSPHTVSDWNVVLIFAEAKKFVQLNLKTNQNLTSSCIWNSITIVLNPFKNMYFPEHFLLNSLIDRCFV